MARKTHTTPEAARDAILKATEEIVVEVGPAGLRISAVAKKAGMAHPNVLHHFGSREGLLKALADRVSDRATKRITAAIVAAKQAPESERPQAVTHILDSAYVGDEGRLAVWLHLSGEKSSLKPNMKRIIDAAHELRQTVHPDAEYESTSRLVMLVTLSLIGEVVSGAAIKQALGFSDSGENRAFFRQWLGNLIMGLSDQELESSIKSLK